MDWDKISSLYRGFTIDPSYQVSVHLAKGFERRRLKCEKLTDDRRRFQRRRIFKIRQSEKRITSGGHDC
jgi:hypothetical protein